MLIVSYFTLKTQSLFLNVQFLINSIAENKLFCPTDITYSCVRLYHSRIACDLLTQRSTPIQILNMSPAIIPYDRVIKAPPLCTTGQILDM